MEEIDWNWKTPEEFKSIVEKWAYDENLYFLDQDEDLMFYNIEWTEAVSPFMFDEKCVKRKYIIDNFLEYMRTLFLNRNTNEIKLIEKNFINDMVAFYSVTNDYNIESA